MNAIDKIEEEILLGTDESNGVDYTCKTYGYIKNDVIYITRQEIIKESENNV